MVYHIKSGDKFLESVEVYTTVGMPDENGNQKIKDVFRPCWTDKFKDRWVLEEGDKPSKYYTEMKESFKEQNINFEIYTELC